MLIPEKCIKFSVYSIAMTGERFGSFVKTDAMIEVYGREQCKIWFRCLFRAWHRK